MGCVVWNFRGRKAIHTEIEKQMFGKQMFSGPCVTMGYREDLDQRGLAKFLPVYHT